MLLVNQSQQQLSFQNTCFLEEEQGSYSKAGDDGYKLSPKLTRTREVCHPYNNPRLKESVFNIEKRQSIW